MSSVKSLLRRTVLQRRRALPAIERERQSARVAERAIALLDAALLRKESDSALATTRNNASLRVLAFCSLASEIDTAAVLRHVVAHERMELVLPRVHDVEAGLLTLHVVRDLERDLALSDGRPRIREPRPDRCDRVLLVPMPSRQNDAHRAAAERDRADVGDSADREAARVGVDVALLPMVACDRRGVRLGYGGGFYDRLLAPVANERRPERVGVALDCQLVDEPLPHAEHDVRLHKLVLHNSVMDFD